MNISKRTGHYLAVLGLFVFGLYAFLLLPAESGAVTTMTVGILSVEVVPEGTTPELETFSLGYNGPGYLDVSGYTVMVDGVIVFAISNVQLSDGEKVTFCANSNNALGCVGAWDGTIFADVGGSVVLKAATGEEVVVINYSDVGNSIMVRETYERAEAVYGEREQVALCHAKETGSYRLSKDQTIKIVSDKGHVTDPLDIIQPFFYRFDAGINYYAGQNWETGAATLLAGCE